MRGEPQGSSRRLGRGELQVVHMWIAEDGDAVELWYGLSEELQLLATDVGNVEEDAGDVAARAGQARDPALGHRIGFEIEPDDGNVLCRLDRCLQRVGIRGDDDV